MPLFVRLQSPTCKDASSPGDGGEGWNSGLIHCHISKAAECRYLLHPYSVSQALTPAQQAFYEVKENQNDDFSDIS